MKRLLHQTRTQLFSPCSCAIPSSCSVKVKAVKPVKMSVVKTVKSRKALLTALEQTPKDKSRWWDHKQRILEHWLDTNGDDIPVEGASALIRGQLERGYKHDHLRIKCWKHIVIELSALVDDDAAATAPSNGGSAAMLARRTSYTNRGAPGAGGAAGDNNTLTDGHGHDMVDLSGLSFVERQEEWLRRKQHALRTKTHDLERAVKDAATFNPNLAISQSSLRPAQVSAVELKLEQMANEAERHARKNSFSLSIQEAKRRADREAAPPVSIQAHNAAPRRRTRMKRRGSPTDDPQASPRRATAPVIAFNDTSHEIGTLNPPGDDDSDEDGCDDNNPSSCVQHNRLEAVSTGEGGDHREPGEHGAGLRGNGSRGGGDRDEVGASDEAEVEEEPFEEGSFFIKVDDKDKGHYKVRDVSRFLLTSMYKRKDRVTRTPGVSLLVGKLEDPPHEEKVVSAMFDTHRFSERTAAQWWEDNGHRFEDARSLAEKKEIDEDRRRTIERNSEVLRRASAPARAAANALKAVTAMSITAPAAFRTSDAPVGNLDVVPGKANTGGVVS